MLIRAKSPGTFAMVCANSSSASTAAGWCSASTSLTEAADRPVFSRMTSAPSLLAATNDSIIAAWLRHISAIRSRSTTPSSLSALASRSLRSWTWRKVRWLRSSCSAGSSGTRAAAAW
ncbi:hypothetical protein H480_11687 [Amycolatopsis vancoresmycina DSM 44592]|uniref:Uncharacterized protein n=1 Tax=Amycolatopsis vancoresmycina DSM 44592 TaxID=1292037 RepID=R1GAH5_9PSEU|nr:hypothetical protein H480_11687 [Amycolatopsis vancoresmycina DSM 44592]